MRNLLIPLTIFCCGLPSCYENDLLLNEQEDGTQLIQPLETSMTQAFDYVVMGMYQPINEHVGTLRIYITNTGTHKGPKFMCRIRSGHFEDTHHFDGLQPDKIIPIRYHSFRRTAPEIIVDLTFSSLYRDSDPGNNATVIGI